MGRGRLDHDGWGRSLELQNQGLSNDAGANWGSSTANGGTPGVVNSINSYEHRPADSIRDPRPGRATVERARDRHGDESPTSRRRASPQNCSTASAARAHSPASPWPTTALSGDGMDEDGVYAGTIPAQADQFDCRILCPCLGRLEQSRTWPAPTDAQRHARRQRDVPGDQHGRNDDDAAVSADHDARRRSRGSIQYSDDRTFTSRSSARSGPRSMYSIWPAFDIAATAAVVSTRRRCGSIFRTTTRGTACGPSI